MARNRKKNVGHSRRKKSLYEVMGGTRLKSRYDKTLEQPPPDKVDKDEPTTESTVAVPERAAQWPRKPRIVQFNAGRIEISIPYQLAIAFLLGIILLVLVVYRVGEGVGESAAKKQKNNLGKLLNQKNTAGPGQNTNTDRKMPSNDGNDKVAESKGNHRIVIQTYEIRAHLEPVQRHFALYGIETEIRSINEMYYLVTKEKYENPQKQGTDGYAAKQKIIELGVQYKAPPGYETFGAKSFKSAFGKRFED
jgi:hypothetical protein